MSDDTKQSLIKQMTWLAALALLALVGYPTVMAARSDGRPDYCFVEPTTHHVPTQGDVTTYVLKGHRPWRIDRNVSTNVPSLDEARRQAELVGCTLR
jgi:hypothetical protein